MGSGDVYKRQDLYFDAMFFDRVVPRLGNFFVRLCVIYSALISAEFKTDAGFKVFCFKWKYVFLNIGRILINNI